MEHSLEHTIFIWLGSPVGPYHHVYHQFWVSLENHKAPMGQLFIDKNLVAAL